MGDTLEGGSKTPHIHSRGPQMFGVCILINRPDESCMAESLGRNQCGMVSKSLQVSLPEVCLETGKGARYGAGSGMF